jgi:hypothetical protein
MSAVSLAEYLILRSDAQDTVLHDSRFSRPPIVNAYSDAFRALRAYNTDPRRVIGNLDLVKTSLARRADSVGIKPKAREEALRCIEAIELFEAAENAFGLRALPLLEAPRFLELEVEGVALSIQPDFIVHTVENPRRVGAVMLRLAKAPDPTACRLEATRQSRGEHRREMARYMIAMMQMLLQSYMSERGEVDRHLIFVADVRLGERIEAGSDHAARLRAIRSGCNHIARLWDTVTPRSSILPRA